MPKGFIIAKWTEDQGLIVQLTYPESIVVDLDDMMRIFFAHITGAGEAGNVLVRLEKAQCSVASHFTGMQSEEPLMVNLMLELGEDPDMFGEAILQQINATILKYLEQHGTDPSKAAVVDKNIKVYLRNALFFLDRLKNMNKEQLIAQIFTSKKKRTILKILQDSARSKKEIRTFLEEELNVIVSNLDITLDPFIKTNLIKQDWLEGLADIYLFLVSDFTIIRAPPAKVVASAGKNRPSWGVAKAYLDQVREFFSTYKPTPQDSFKVAYTMLHPDKYDYIAILREKAYPRNKIPKSSGLTYSNIDVLIDSMIKDNILTTITDKKRQEWVFLLCDLKVQIFYPEYMIEKIRKDHMMKKIKSIVAIKHLELLEKSYVKEK